MTTPKKKTWCRHIKWIYLVGSGEGMGMYADGYLVFIPRSWRCCPICFKLRHGYTRYKGKIITADKMVKDVAKIAQKRAEQLCAAMKNAHPMTKALFCKTERPRKK